MTPTIPADERIEAAAGIYLDRHWGWNREHAGILEAPHREAARDYAGAMLAAADAMDHTRGIVRVCDLCWAPVKTTARHRVSVSDGSPDSGTLACLWPCGHDVSFGERECFACRDVTKDPF